MQGTPGEGTGPTNKEAGAIVGRVPSRGSLSRIQAQYELSGLKPRIFQPREPPFPTPSEFLRADLGSHGLDHGRGFADVFRRHEPEHPNRILHGLKLRASCRRSDGKTAQIQTTDRLAQTRPLRWRSVRSLGERRNHLFQTPNRKIPATGRHPESRSIQVGVRLARNLHPCFATEIFPSGQTAPWLHENVSLRRGPRNNIFQLGTRRLRCFVVGKHTSKRLFWRRPVLNRRQRRAPVVAVNQASESLS